MTDDTHAVFGQGTNIHLVSGKQLDFQNPLAAEITDHDIGHALARIGRYVGHTSGKSPYTVAEHAVLVSTIVREHYGEKTLALAALHHDDAEFVSQDIPTPLKNYLLLMGVDWRTLVEKPIMQAISNTFSIPMDEFAAGVIKDADDMAYAAEVATLKQAGHGPIPVIDSEILVKVAGWIQLMPTQVAETLYIQLHRSLMRERDEGISLDVEPRDEDDYGDLA